MPYALAVDGGGTKTEFALLDATGTVKRRVRLGPSNYQNVGVDQAQSVLQQGVAQLLTDTVNDRLMGASFGLAGLDTPSDEQVYARMIVDIFGEDADKVRIENDCFIALHSGTLGEAGMALIAGTGSMAIACNEVGERARSGGWGYRFGDEGSGYYIGYQALVRAVRGRDGRGPTTILAEMIEEKLSGDVYDLVTQYTIDDPGPDRIASLAPLVSQAASGGDTVAQEILSDAAHELVLGALAITRQITFEHHPLRVVLAGGAFNSAVLRDLVTSQLTAAFGAAKCIRPKLPPVAGACVLALRQAGIELGDVVRQNLVKSLTDGR